MTATAWFFTGYLAGLVTLILAMWVGDTLKDRSEDYAPDFQRLSIDELAARREKAIKSLTESVG